MTERSLTKTYLGVPDGCPLTARELEVVKLVCSGTKQYKHIATELDISVSTVRTHLNNSYRKLGVPSATALAGRMANSGWFDLVPEGLEDGRITRVQNHYLAARFKAQEKPSEDNETEAMFWLRGMFYEADKIPPWEKPLKHPYSARSNSSALTPTQKRAKLKYNEAPTKTTQATQGSQSSIGSQDAEGTQAADD